MSRMIIENRTDISDLQALDMVSEVVADGRVSGNNNQYCYATLFTLSDSRKYLLTTTLNKSSDRFLITKQGGEDA